MKTSEGGVKTFYCNNIDAKSIFHRCKGSAKS